MKRIFAYWIIFLIFLIAFIYFAITLAFSVPVDEIKPMTWLNQNRHSELVFYFFIGFGIFALIVLMIFENEIIHFEIPLNPASLLTIATTVLLFSNFFTVKSEISSRTYDTHPLIFYSAIYLISLALLNGAVNTLRLAVNGSYRAK